MTGIAICEEIDRILAEIIGQQRTSDNGANVLSAARKFLDKIDFDLTQLRAEPDADAVLTEHARANDGEDEEDSEDEGRNSNPQDEIEMETHSPNYDQLYVELQENVEAPSGTIGMT